ncbi:hypothetical protein [Bacteroides sp.]|uniref:hypothetical protein n=1 Tax=Bacteroides sp. TaxID=29523 RepID=UPI0026171F27|nr:hypothetical protein [Bacteroides sp.]MDD3039046.1 hypothetical protein [Bacteroides sp.]
MELLQRTKTNAPPNEQKLRGIPVAPTLAEIASEEVQAIVIALKNRYPNASRTEEFWFRLALTHWELDS